jgi:endonuclease/exonuclease/phosphatase family metal-dependent hydrolase
MIKKFFIKPYSDLNWWNKILLTFNFLIIILIFISYISPFINPNYGIIFAFFGLVYPMLLLLNIIAMVYWIIKRKRQYIFSLLIILIGILPLRNFFQITLFQNDLDKDKSFKIMTFNVRVFDLYNWTTNTETKDNIIAFIIREKPDVICFQEYYRGDKIHFSVNKELKDSLGLKHVYEHFSGTTVPKNKKGKNSFGTAIFSKYPIIKEGLIEFANEKSNNCIFADIVIEEDTVRIYNGHLGSIRLQQADYVFLGNENIDNHSSKKDKEQNIVNRMINAYQKRADQTVQMTQEINQSPYPAILCVDLNDVPLSYAYRQISAILYDTFVQSGNGVDGTYIGDNFFNRIFPVNRIDYIFTDYQFKVAHFQTHTEDLSDHRAVSVEVELNK